METSNSPYELLSPEIEPSSYQQDSVFDDAFHFFPQAANSIIFFCDLNPQNKYL